MRKKHRLENNVSVVCNIVNKQTKHKNKEKQTNRFERVFGGFNPLFHFSRERAKKQNSLTQKVDEKRFLEEGNNKTKANNGL